VNAFLGNLGLSPKDMAKLLLQAVVEYLNSNPKSFIHHLDIIVFQEKMINDFVESMRKVVEKKKTLWQRLTIKLSNFFFGPQLSEAGKKLCKKMLLLLKLKFLTLSFILFMA